MKESYRTILHDEYVALRKKHPISHAVVNITDNCNLRCKYCFTNRNNSVITDDILEQTVQFLKKENGEDQSISFFGGEPMLYFDQLIVPFVERHPELSYYITTNGTLLFPERVKWLYDHKVHILLSIDGDEFTQNDQRPAANGNSFQQIKENIPTLLQYYPKVTFRSTVNPDNAGRLFDNYCAAYNMGFQQYFVCPNAYDKWTPEQVQALNLCIFAIGAKMYNDIIDDNHPLLWSSVSAALKEHLLPPSVEKPTVERCGLGMGGVGVDCFGNINGCQEHNTNHNDDIFHIGNIWDGIDEDLHLNLLNNYLKYEPFCAEDENRCEHCLVKNKCAAGICPSRSFDLFGIGNAHTLIQCQWDDILYRMTYYWLTRIQNEPNENMNKFFEQITERKRK